MKPDQLTDNQLLQLVVRVDKELCDEGMEIRGRELEVVSRLMKSFGYIGFTRFGVGKPPIVERIEAAFHSIYSKRDLAIGGHIGVFMFRDVFGRFGIPLVYGTAAFNPFEMVDLTRLQLGIINEEPDAIDLYIDQFSDVFDIQYGIEGLKKPYADIELVTRFIDLSRLHLHAAAAVLTGGYDGRGAVQSALLATELALKAGAAAHGLTEKDIKDQLGHHVEKIADFIGTKWPDFDVDRVKRVLATHPKYVANRYDAKQPDRKAVGHIVMGTQYLVSEVVRQMSDRRSRESFQPVPSRTYPA